MTSPNRPLRAMIEPSLDLTCMGTSFLELGFDFSPYEFARTVVAGGDTMRYFRRDEGERGAGCFLAVREFGSAGFVLADVDFLLTVANTSDDAFGDDTFGGDDSCF